MGGIGSYDAFEDPKGKVRVIVYPPNCICKHRPIDMSIIAAAKLQYKRNLLDIRAPTMTVAPAFCAQAKASKKASEAGLVKDNALHVSDVATLLKDAWDGVSQTAIAR